MLVAMRTVVVGRMMAMTMAEGGRDDDRHDGGSDGDL